MDYFQFLFLAGSGLLVLVQGIRGWRLGVVRQFINLSAMILAYGVAILAGRLLTPLLRSSGYPDLVVSIVAGSIFGGVVYVALTAGGSIIFRRTSEKSLGLVRLGYGAGGTVLGCVGALVTVWMSVLGIRCLGTVAEAEMAMAATPEARHAGMTPGPMAEGLAHLKQSLDHGPVGDVMNGTDPVPERFYIVLRKMTQVLASADSMQRFVTFPGTKALSQNPRIIALQKDPEIARHAVHGEVMALLGNPKIVAAVNDPEVESQVKNFALEKALDYALASNTKRGSN